MKHKILMVVAFVTVSSCMKLKKKDEEVLYSSIKQFLQKPKFPINDAVGDFEAFRIRKELRSIFEEITTHDNLKTRYKPAVTPSQDQILKSMSKAPEISTKESDQEWLHILLREYAQVLLQQKRGVSWESLSDLQKTEFFYAYEQLVAV